MSLARQWLVRTLAFSCLLVGCNQDHPPQALRSAPQAPPLVLPEAKPERRELLVLAASSLTDAFQGIKKVYQPKHPEVELLLSFAGSSALAAQVGQGGVGDVLATASEDNLETPALKGHLKSSAVFAYNQLVVAVPLNNPGKLKSFADLVKAKRIVLGTENVPVGKYADELLERASATLGTKFRDTVMAHVVSREANVRLVLSKVELGEADAAIVYSTDIYQPGCTPSPDDACQRAHPIPIPVDLAERATYPIAVLAHATRPELGRAFIDFVLSDEGQAVLAEYGFIPVRDHEPGPAQ